MEAFANELRQIYGTQIKLSCQKILFSMGLLLPLLTLTTLTCSYLLPQLQPNVFFTYAVQGGSCHRPHIQYTLVKAVWKRYSQAIINYRPPHSPLRACFLRQGLAIIVARCIFSICAPHRQADTRAAYACISQCKSNGDKKYVCINNRQVRRDEAII